MNRIGEGYPTWMRLRRRDEFGALLRRQQKAVGPHVVVLARPQTDGPPRLGVMISRRVSKSSPRRHQLKRWVVELFRRELALSLDACDLLVLFRRDLPTDGHALLDREIRGLFARAIEARPLWSRGRARRRRR